MPARRITAILWVITAIMVMTIVGVRIKELVSDPVLDCIADSANVDAGTPTIWAAAEYCSGADIRVIVDIIIEMNPQLDPMNLQTNQTIKLPIDNNRAKWITQEEYILMQDNYEGNED
jgi:hypothetical protein